MSEQRCMGAIAGIKLPAKVSQLVLNRRLLHAKFRRDPCRSIIECRCNIDFEVVVPRKECSEHFEGQRLVGGDKESV
jgi:hypothetical protein